MAKAISRLATEVDIRGILPVISVPTLVVHRTGDITWPVEGVPTLEERMEDLTAVLDAAGVERAALFGASEGAPMSALFAATYVDRVIALVMYGSYAKGSWAEGLPLGAHARAGCGWSRADRRGLGPGLLARRVRSQLRRGPRSRSLVGPV